MGKKAISPGLLLALTPFAVCAVMLLSIRYGAKSMEWRTVLDAFLHFDAENVDHQIVRTSRLPRAAGSVLIGAFLAVSGSIMQGMTRNYLASPSIMGVTDGAAFAITVSMIMSPNAGSLELMGSSFLGSIAGVVLVFGMAWLIPGGLSPVRMAILGTIVGTFMSSLASALSVYFHVSQNVSFWFHARLHQIDPHMLKMAAPLAIIGLGLGLCIARQVTILSLGDEVAAGLGQKTLGVKIAALIAVALLTGISVALAGKIAFVGLLIPHITRFLVGVDYRWVIPCSGVLGGLFLGVSDILSRFLNYPYEMPIGVVTSAVGVPFFLYLIRKKGGQEQHA